MFKGFSSESTVDTSCRSSVLIVEYSLQLKRKKSAASVSRSTVSLKPCLNLCSFKWLKFNFGRVSSLRPLLWCTAKTEFSLGLLKLRIIYLNFQEWHFDKQKMLSTSFKFLKKDTPCNCADTKKNCVFLAFLSDLSCVSRLLRNKNYNYMLLILIFTYIYIYIYIYIYTHT